MFGVHDDPLMTSTEWNAVLVGVAIVVLSAGLVALFRWLSRWFVRMIATEFRAVITEIVTKQIDDKCETAADPWEEGR